MFELKHFAALTHENSQGQNHASSVSAVSALKSEYNDEYATNMREGPGAWSQYTTAEEAMIFGGNEELDHTSRDNKRKDLSGSLLNSQLWDIGAADSAAAFASYMDSSYTDTTEQAATGVTPLDTFKTDDHPPPNHMPDDLVFSNPRLSTDFFKKCNRGRFAGRTMERSPCSSVSSALYQSSSERISPGRISFERNSFEGNSFEGIPSERISSERDPSERVPCDRVPSDYPYTTSDSGSSYHHFDSSPESRIPLGEKGRGDLKSLIRLTVKSHPHLRQRVREIAKLKSATIPQLLCIAKVCGLWEHALQISNQFVRSKAAKQNATLHLKKSLRSLGAYPDARGSLTSSSTLAAVTLAGLPIFARPAENVNCTTSIQSDLGDNWVTEVGSSLIAASNRQEERRPRANSSQNVSQDIFKNDFTRSSPYHSNKYSDVSFDNLSFSGAWSERPEAKKKTGRADEPFTHMTNDGNDLIDRY